MEKKDLKSVLKEGQKETKEEVVVKKHKKPMQLRDIENRSSNNHIKINNQTSDEHMKEIINKEKKNIYFKSWNSEYSLISFFERESNGLIILLIFLCIP